MKNFLEEEFLFCPICGMALETLVTKSLPSATLDKLVAIKTTETCPSCRLFFKALRTEKNFSIRVQKGDIKVNGGV